MEENLLAAKKLIAEAKNIVVLQADNPDGDSLASSLALEDLLCEQGKNVTMYCGVDIPSYLHHLEGYDRVTKDLPRSFDLSILVDCSTITLLEQLQKNHQVPLIGSKPCLVIDHHLSEANLPFSFQQIIDDSAVSTGELLYMLATNSDWDITPLAAGFLAASILADSLGLTTDTTSARSVFTLASLIEKGANLAELDAKRRSSSAKPVSIVTYKGLLLQRIKYYFDNQLAMAVIPWAEIEQYSPLYNPAVLILEELRMAEQVRLSIVLKVYPGGRITGKLRCNNGTAIAGDLAAHFGGGGHASAAGFKTYDWKLEELQKEILNQTEILLKDKTDEAI